MESIKNTNAYSELENQINSLTKQRVNEPEVYDPSNMTIQLTAAEEHSSKLDQENSSGQLIKLLLIKLYTLKYPSMRGGPESYKYLADSE